MHRTLPLQVCFKGNRDYLQGGDLCNALMDQARQIYAGDISAFTVAFHRFVNRQPEAYWADEASIKPPDAVGEFSVAGTNGRLIGWLVESDRQVDCRVPFDEDKIARFCTSVDDAVTFHGDCGYLPIEVAVSITKQLHNRVLHDPGGRWIFTKLNLRRLFEPADANSLTV